MAGGRIRRHLDHLSVAARLSRLGTSAALAAALVLAAPPASAASPADAREVMRVVLAFEARFHEREVAQPPCIVRRVGLTSLGGNRREIERYEAPPAPPPPRPAPARSGAAMVVDSSEIRLSPFFGWRRVAETHDGSFELAGELPVREGMRLQAAERAVMLAPRQRQRIGEIDPDWLQAPLAFCAGASFKPYLEIGSPAFLGDFAFVSADFICVLCGQGMMIALRRVGQDWRIMAAAIPWVS